MDVSFAKKSINKGCISLNSYNNSSSNNNCSTVYTPESNKSFKGDSIGLYRI